VATDAGYPAVPTDVHDSVKDQLAIELKEAQRLLMQARILWEAKYLRPDPRTPAEALEWKRAVDRFVRRTTIVR
jgi:hypothetical protein